MLFSIPRRIYVDGWVAFCVSLWEIETDYVVLYRYYIYWVLLCFFICISCVRYCTILYHKQTNKPLTAKPVIDSTYNMYIYIVSLILRWFVISICYIICIVQKNECLLVFVTCVCVCVCVILCLSVFFVCLQLVHRRNIENYLKVQL